MAKKQRTNFSRLDLVIVIVFIILALTSIYFTFNLFNHRIVEIRNISVSYSVSDKIGLDLGTSSLIFGRLVQGGSLTRTLDVQNEYDFPIKLVFETDNQLKEILSWKNISYLNPHSLIPIPFTLSIPKNYSFGNYSGTLHIKIYKT